MLFFVTIDLPGGQEGFGVRGPEALIPDPQCVSARIMREPIDLYRARMLALHVGQSA